MIYSKSCKRGPNLFSVFECLDFFLGGQVTCTTSSVVLGDDRSTNSFNLFVLLLSASRPSWTGGQGLPKKMLMFANHHIEKIPFNTWYSLNLNSISGWLAASQGHDASPILLKLIAWTGYSLAMYAEVVCKLDLKARATRCHKIL